MIKILFFVEKLTGGGAEKVLRDLVNHMDQTAFDITVQSVWPYDEGKHLVPGVKYKTVYPFKNGFTEKIYRFEAVAKLIYPLHIKDDYDIECAFLEYGPTKIIAASTNKKAKKIAWVHCDLNEAVKNLGAFLSKTSGWYQKYDCVACVSQKVKESFDAIFQSAIRSEVVYNVVEDQLIRERSTERISNLKKRRLTVLAVGSIYPPKNYLRLLKAHERLLQSGVRHDLWILGDGEQRHLVEQYIRDHDLTDSVTLFGFQNNPYPYMRVADVVACSSNYEGFSTVITESTILGKAIVTTECSGMKEILGDSEYGLITENSDEGFYKGLKMMLTNPQIRSNYARKSALRGQRFSMDSLVSRTQEFFAEILGN